jgi:hypothetical protein
MLNFRVLRTLASIHSLSIERAQQYSIVRNSSHQSHQATPGHAMATPTMGVQTVIRGCL